jgi:hypothetical protein
VIARSYDHATTKSKRPREVPVHPALAQLLDAWRGKGCTEILGRTPEPDDLLIPSRERAMRSRHHTRNKLLEDLERLGLRSRRGHDLRRTFITLARADGARADLLEMISHAPRGDIINIYTSMPWANLCAEVAKLNIVLPQDAEIIQLRRAANDISPEPQGSGLTTRLTTVSAGSSNWPLSLLKSASKLVEAPGVEGDRNSSRPAPSPENPAILRALRSLEGGLNGLERVSLLQFVTSSSGSWPRLRVFCGQLAGATSRTLSRACSPAQTSSSPRKPDACLSA